MAAARKVLNISSRNWATPRGSNCRFQAIYLEMLNRVRRQNERLDSDTANLVENNTALQTALEEQKAAAVAIEREFSAYKQQHALGSELGALQDAVAGLQAQLRARENTKK
jgi:hypothetical protein